jgi:hypothetical protein
MCCSSCDAELALCCRADLVSNERQAKMAKDCVNKAIDTHADYCCIGAAQRQAMSMLLDCIGSLLRVIMQQPTHTYW